MTKNRAGLARENAGLSLGQAAKMLGVRREELMAIEISDANVSDRAHELAELYGVRVEWLMGDCERYDYASVDKAIVCGLSEDGLSPHDRAIIAEFAASMPRGNGTAAERLERVMKRNGKPT